MQIKVILHRHAQPEYHLKLRPLLVNLRNLAMQQPGYISGETLVNCDNPQDVLVISTWKSLEDWDRWLNKKERQELQKEIDNILQEPTFYSVYYYG